MMGSQFKEVYRLGWTCKWGTCAGVCLNMCDMPFFAHLGKSSPQGAEQACVRCYAMDVTLMVGLAQEILVFVKNENDLLTLILFQTHMLLL